MAVIDREAAEVAHEITEAAKAAFKENAVITYAQHLDMEARVRIGWDSEFHYYIECRHGAWRVVVDVAGRGHEEPAFIG